MPPSVRLIAGVTPPEGSVAFTFEGRPLTAHPGEAIASALMRAGLPAMRRARLRDEPRGYYCGMGLCWECAVHVEGLGVVRACLQPAAAGQVVTMADRGHAP